MLFVWSYIQHLYGAGSTLAGSFINLASVYYSPGVSMVEYYRSIVLTLAISLGTYLGSVRHIRKLHEELKDHLSRKISIDSEKSQD